MATHVYTIPTREALQSVGDKHYDNWTTCLTSYLVSQDLWDLIHSSSQTTSQESQVNGETDVAPTAITAASSGEESPVNREMDATPTTTITIAGEESQVNAEMDATSTTTTITPAAASPAWRRRNAAALHAIHISLSSDLLHQIREIASAKEAWDTLADMHRKKLPPKDESLGASGADQQVNTGAENIASRYFPLIVRVREGDAQGVRNFVRENHESVRFQFPPGQSTALHLAASLGNTEIAEELLEVMEDEDLEIQDRGGSTALHIAAANGHRRLVERMLEKNSNLVKIVNKRNVIPLREACGKNHKELATLLYGCTPFYWMCEENDGKYGASILKCCILAQMFDIALDVLRRHPRMATTKDTGKINVVIQLSSMPTAFLSGSKLSIWLRWIYALIHLRIPGPLHPTTVHQGSSDEELNFGAEHDDIINVDKLRRIKHDGAHQGQNYWDKLLSVILKLTGTKHIYDLKRVHICSLELLNLAFKQVSRSDFRKLEEMGVHEAFHKAIKNGIVEFVMRAVKACPALLYRFDKDSRNMFMSAVEFRQEKIFNLLYPLPDRATIVSLVDNDRNTMLHLAGMLSPDAKLSHISGAALQMQRELQWFLEVERVMNPMYKDNTNSNNETARQIFTRTHKDLASAGEKWMKETATSSTVVGALIITIMFTAAFTVPGGNNQETGIPILLHEKAFKIFIVSDSISLFAASTSVLMFLSILTSRYAEADFLSSLPTKLVIGLSTLFISIAAMMVTFCATVMIVMDGRLEYVVPIILMASVPVSLFMLLQFPLLVQIFRSTYGSGIFHRNTKPWL